VRARAPASSANLGPGFDALAIALRLYVDVTVEPADELTITSNGEGAAIPANHYHLAARVAKEIAGHDRFAITVRSEIPVGRGLGSSAALAVATAAATRMTVDAFAVGARFDGHPENAAASVQGGLVTAATVDGRPVAYRLPLDPHLAFVVLVPERQLPTKQARAALPSTVSHADASFNLGRLGLLIAGLGDHRRLIPAATEDRLHQPHRSALFPEAPLLLNGLVEAGALATSWSGAGPSMLAICTVGAAGTVAQAGAELLGEVGLPGQVLQLEADHQGVVIDSRAR
jgi:homoserine kinase